MTESEENMKEIDRRRALALSRLDYPEWRGVIDRDMQSCKKELFDLKMQSEENNVLLRKTLEAFSSLSIKFDKLISLMMVTR